MIIRLLKGLLAVAFAFFLVGASAVMAQPLGPVSGVWKTSEGEMKLTQKGSDVKGPYDQDNGRIIGTLSGHTLTGVWVEADSSVTCDSSRDDSLHWGGITFNFNDDFTAFSGTWTYCDQTSERDWSGTLIARAKVMIK